MIFAETVTWCQKNYSIDHCSKKVSLYVACLEPSNEESVKLKRFLNPAIVCYQVREMFHENGMFRGQLTTMKDRLKTVETELAIHQDKVAKLTAEIDENQKNTSLSAIDMDNMQIVCVFALLFVCE